MVGTVEQNIAIVVVCLPVLKTLLRAEQRAQLNSSIHESTLSSSQVRKQASIDILYRQSGASEDK
jgi:hypothetical protein